MARAAASPASPFVATPSPAARRASGGARLSDCEGQPACGWGVKPRYVAGARHGSPADALIAPKLANAAKRAVCWTLFWVARMVRRADYGAAWVCGVGVSDG